MYSENATKNSKKCPVFDLTDKKSRSNSKLKWLGIFYFKYVIHNLAGILDRQI